MAIETTNISYELLNNQFIDRVFSGHIKEAQEAATLYTRERLYEDGILRRLFESVTVTQEDLDAEMDSDQPSIICEKEPLASSATFVSFKGTGERRYFQGRRYRVPFGKVESERITKSKFELMTIRMPINTWLQENQVKMVQEEEDSKFIETINDCVAQNTAGQSLTFSMNSGSFKDAFVAGQKALVSLRLPQGKVLMNKNTYLDSLKLKTDEIGFKPQEDRFSRGVDGEDSFMGVPVVTTIKDNLVPENVMYFFAPKDYFCKFFFLQDATLFMKTEADMVHFHTYEAPGFGIGNTHGVVKVTLS